MKICIVEMPSYTYAVKAAKLLKSRGYNCKIARREKNCGFSVKIYGQTDDAVEIFDRYSVPYDNIVCGGVT